MITLYIEAHKIEEFALFDKEMPHWDKVIKSGINLCINISDNELDEKLKDELDPLSIAYKNSGTMSLPMALGNYIDGVKEDLTQTIDKPNAIFILDVEESSASEIQKKLGMAVFSCNNLPDNLFSKNFYKEYRKNEIVKNGWNGVIQFDKQLSNSLVITDNFFFKNEDRGENRGIKNLIPFLDAFLPDHLEIEYHITIVSPNSKQMSDLWWVKEYGKLVTSAKLLRDYPINLELVLSKSVFHKRWLVSNYVRSETDVGFDFFLASNLEKVSESNYFRYIEIFRDLDNKGTKNFESNMTVFEDLSEQCTIISNDVKSGKNTRNYKLFGCNADKTIKNRLLN